MIKVQLIIVCDECGASTGTWGNTTDENGRLTLETKDIDFPKTGSAVLASPSRTETISNSAASAKA